MQSIESGNSEKQKIIVSLTSYPARIHTVHKVINSLFQQTKKADHIMLWLAEEDFPDREKDLPTELLEQKEQGLSIMWCEDLKPHKKYFYVMQLYPIDIVITVDDDVYYDKNLIKELYTSYEKFPYAVSARRVHYMTFEGSGEIQPYEKWFWKCTHMKGTPSMNLFATGVGGVLYPPNCMHPELFHKENIINCALYADDIWLKFMQILMDTPVVWVETTLGDIDMEDVSSEGLFTNQNANGGNNKVIRLTQEVYGDRVQIKRDELYEQVFLRPLIEMIDKLKKESKIAVYGAGIIAHQFLHFLQGNLPEKKIECFVVTQKQNNPYDIEGIPVIELDELISCEGYCMVVATAEKYHQEILISLKNRDCKNNLLLRPYIFRLLPYFDLV